MTKVFIDGSAGTTGLKIYDRLSTRDDISLVALPDELRKDISLRKEAMNSSDVVFLCLPDDAAIEAVDLVSDPDVTIIDTSTAHRTKDGWTYGFPEVNNLREMIRGSKRIANPGCHASGFISLISPLMNANVIGEKDELSCVSLTGYSGGGKKMIADYESSDRGSQDHDLLKGPRMYGLTQSHKHLPEMMKLCSLNKAPAFMPIVGDFYSGMEVIVTLFDKDIDQIKEIYRNCYPKESIVHYEEDADESGFMSASAFSGFDDMQISVYGNCDRILLISRFDNLGKGASGAAVQNMNISLGLPETKGLKLSHKK